MRTKLRAIARAAWMMALATLVCAIAVTGIAVLIHLDRAADVFRASLTLWDRWLVGYALLMLALAVIVLFSKPQNK